MMHGAVLFNQTSELVDQRLQRRQTRGQGCFGRRQVDMAWIFFQDHIGGWCSRGQRLKDILLAGHVGHFILGTLPQHDGAA